MNNCWTLLRFNTWLLFIPFLCQAQTGPEVTMLPQINHSANLSVAIFSGGQGRFAATGDEKGFVKIWDSHQRSIIQNISVQGKITALYFSPGEDSLLIESETNAGRALTIFDWLADRIVRKTAPKPWQWLVSDFASGTHFFRLKSKRNIILKTNADFEPVDTTFFSDPERFEFTAIARANTSWTVAFGYESGLVELLDLRTMHSEQMPSTSSGNRTFISSSTGQPVQVKTADAMAVKTLRFSAGDAFLVAGFEPSDPNGAQLFNFAKPRPGKIVVWSVDKKPKQRLSFFPFKFSLDDAFLVESSGEIYARGSDAAMTAMDSIPPQIRCFTVANVASPKWSAEMKDVEFTLSPDERLLLAFPHYLRGMDWFETSRLQNAPIPSAPVPPYNGVAFFHPVLPRICFTMPDYGWNLNTWKRNITLQPDYYAEGTSIEPFFKQAQSGEIVGRIYSANEPYVATNLENLLQGIATDTFSGRFRLLLFQERKSGLQLQDSLIIPHRLADYGAGFPKLSSRLGYVSIQRNQQKMDVFAIQRNNPALAASATLIKSQFYQMALVSSISLQDKWRFETTMFTPNDSMLFCFQVDQFSPKPAQRAMGIEWVSVSDMVTPQERLSVFEARTLRQLWSIPLQYGMHLYAKVTDSYCFVFDPNIYTGQGGFETPSTQLQILDVKNGRLVDTCHFSFSVRAIYPDPTGPLLLIIPPENDGVYVFDWQKKVWRYKLETKVGVVQSIDFRPQDSILLISGDGLYEVWNYDTGKLLATLLITTEGEVVYTPQGWYMASSAAAARNLSFRKGKQVWPVQQFDLQLNRPDKVIAQTGFASVDEIKEYREAWKKRLEKYGLKSDTLLLTEASQPTVTISNSNELPFQTSKPDLHLDLKISAANDPIQGMQIWINQVPVYHGKGFVLNIPSRKTMTIPIQLELSPTKNRIEIQVWDAAGHRSGLESAYSYYDTLYLPDLYAVFIGVSNYQHHPPLEGPAADVRLLSSLYSDPKHSPAAYTQKVSLNRLLFKQVFLDTFLNESVTLENMARLDSFFSRAKPGDYALVYYAGHGMLTDSAQYFLSTWDTDFKHPALRALSYDSLLERLTSCPARQKLFWVNACKSGEYDKDMIRFQRMKSLFPDFRQMNGVQVIAASTAEEAAYAASPKTGCLTVFGWVLADFLVNFNREDDATNPADLNFDGRYTVSECAAYLARNIALLTDDAQQSELRQFNSDEDFRIWKKWIRLSRKIKPCKE